MHLSLWIPPVLTRVRAARLLFEQPREALRALVVVALRRLGGPRDDARLAEDVAAGKLDGGVGRVGVGGRGKAVVADPAGG